MAIQNTLIAKIGGALVAVGGTGVAGYVYRNELSDIWNADNRVFLVQATTVTSGISDINKEEHYCSLNTEIDKDCEVLDLNFNEQKYVDSQKIINSSTAAKQLTNNSFYKLIVNRWKIKSLENNADVSIEIKNGSTSLATLKIISTMYESTPEKPVDNWSGLKVLVQAKKSVVETNDMNLTTDKCKFVISNTDSEIKCSVYKFINHSSSKHTLDFSKIKKLTKFNEVQAGQYYILDFDVSDNDETAKKTITDQNIKNIFIKKDSTTNVALTFKSKIISNLKDTENTYTNTQALLLNNFEKDQFNSTYIFVKSTTDAGQDGFSFENHNYKCKIGSTTDDDCSLFELTDKEKTIEQITNFEKSAVNATLKDSSNKYFKIFANNEIIKGITTWGNGTTIDVVNKDTDTTVYKKFTPLFLVENGKVTKIKTTLLMSTATQLGSEIDSATFSNTMTHKCVIGSITTENDCDIYKFASKPDPKNLEKSLTGTLEKTQAKDDWKVGDSYLIHLKNNASFTLPEPNGQTISVLVKVSDSDKKAIATLNIKNLLWNSETFNGDASKLLVLSEQ